MEANVIDIGGRRCLIAAADGEPVRNAGGARALIEDAMNERASVIVVPVMRLDASFFQLRSGLAGEVLQKVLNYKMKFAVLGDISAHVAVSEALRDFVIECERGDDILFVADTAALEARLSGLRSRSDAPAG